MTKMRLQWKGKWADELTKEELLEALEYAYNELQELRINYSSMQKNIFKRR